MTSVDIARPSAETGTAETGTAKPSITSQFRAKPLRIDEQRIAPGPSFADPADERLHRKQQLAGAFRVFAGFGYNLGASGHITARDVGASVEEAAWLFITADQSAHAQLLAEAAGTPTLIRDEVAAPLGRTPGLRRLQLPALLRRHRGRAARSARLTAAELASAEPLAAHDRPRVQR